MVMPLEVNQAIPSLHPRHKEQRLVLVSELFVWPYHCHLYKAAASVADCSFDISPRKKTELDWRSHSALWLHPQLKIKLLFQSVELILF
jgi:hypothetical protein